MRPARSAISFTVASGAGFGLLAMLGLLASSGALPAGSWFAATAVALALAAVGFGLLSARVRPGPPGRAGAAWPPRVGALAAATCLAALGFAAGWLVHGEADGLFRLLGLAAAALCGLSVHATGAIYTARASIPAWRNRWVAPNFLALALLTGTLWLNALVNLFGRPSPDVSMILVLALFLAFYLKRKYWRFIDSVDGPPPPAGGGAGFRLAREHAARRRRQAFLLLFALPLVCSLAAMETTGWIAIPASLLAALGAIAGAVLERWLFFAEAREAAPAGR